MENTSLTGKLSPHLFWDVDVTNLAVDESKTFIVKRVMEYGLLNDWIQIYHAWGINVIAEVATQIRELDPKSAALISVLTHIPLEKFRCFITEPSTPQPWNF